MSGADGKTAFVWKKVLWLMQESVVLPRTVLPGYRPPSGPGLPPYPCPELKYYPCPDRTLTKGHLHPMPSVPVKVFFGDEIDSRRRAGFLGISAEDVMGCYGCLPGHVGSRTDPLHASIPVPDAHCIGSVAEKGVSELSVIGSIRIWLCL